ncbi:MAG: VCBS repeat-containing protein [Pyrinomonadaceae bacterium]|nr:VCBS repeat-containing protein [Pyrinomonadaceae bacterium]
MQLSPPIDRRAGRVTSVFSKALSRFVVSALMTAMLLSQLAVPAAAQTTWNYTAVGDSLCYGLFAFSGYVPRYRNFLQTDNGVTVNLNNLGVNGWTSSQLLNALVTDANFRSSISNSRIVTWDIGGNDLLDARSSYKSSSCGGADNQNCLRTTLATFKTNLDAIIQEILELRSTSNTIIRTMDMYNPYVNTDRNANTWANDGGLNDYQVFKPYLDELNNYIHITATENGIACAKVYAAFNGVAGDMDAGARGYISFDALHPNDTGHGVIATQFRGATIIPRARVAETFDFDGDEKTDLAVWNPASGNWQIINSSNNSVRTQAWGAASFSDVPVPGDYDGDGKTDLAVFRMNEGVWYIFNSQNGTVKIQPWGANGDKPVPGDYDGDGRTDIAVFRAGAWYVLQSSNNSLFSQQFGTATDRTAQGDFDGDGKTDLAVFRPSNGAWYIRKSANGALRVQAWGASGDIAVPGDYDGDFKTDVAVWRATSGFWYILRSSNESLQAQQWGNQSFDDKAAPGDYDGDGKADLAVWRAGSGYWYVSRSSDAAVISQQWGQSGDVPLPSTYISE